MKSKKNYFLLLLLVTFKLTAQTPLKEGTWYAFDVKDKARELVLTVSAESNYSGFKVERKLVKSKKANKKLKLKDRLKKLAASTSNTSNSKDLLHPLEGRFSYTHDRDIRDKEIYNGEYTYEDKLHKVDLEKFYGEDSKEAKEINRIYGYVFPITDGFYKDVSFLSGGSYQENANRLEAMFIVGKDREATKAKAASLNYEDELKKYYLPDFSTGRKSHPYVKFEDYSTELELDQKTGEFELPNYTSAFFLPFKTIEGRSIKFERSAAFQIELSQNGQAIETKLPRTKKFKKVESQFELQSRSMGRLKPGKYQLTYKIYDTPFYNADFEVYTYDNPKLDEEIETYHFIRGNRSDYLIIDQKVKREAKYKTPFAFQIDVTPMMPLVGKDDDIKEFQVKIFKDGNLFAIMSDQDEYMKGTKNVAHALKVHVTELNVKEYLKLDNGMEETEFLILDKNTPHDQWKPLDANTVVDGAYRMAYFTNGKLFAEANFTVKNKEIVKQGLQIEQGTDPKRFIFEGVQIPNIYIPITYK